MLTITSCILSDRPHFVLQIKYGEVTYDTTFEDYTMLTGKTPALSTS